MPLVPAKCTQCGAEIEVDNTKEAMVCKYCGTPFIVEKAINHYITNNTVNNTTNNYINADVVNVSGVNKDNLLLRSKQYLSSGDAKKAIEYYNRVLDIDANCKEAIDGLNIANIIASANRQFEQRNYDIALDDYKKALALDNRNEFVKNRINEIEKNILDSFDKCPVCKRVEKGMRRCPVCNFIMNDYTEELKKDIIRVYGKLD